MRAAATLRGAAFAAACLSLGACAHKQPPPMYMWETFPRMQYDTLLRPGAPPLDQVTEMEAHAERARASGAALPPGFRAHLGMLKLASGDPDQARQLWLAEKVAFPESAAYMDQLLKRLDGSSKKDNPA